MKAQHPHSSANSNDKRTQSQEQPRLKRTRAKRSCDFCRKRKSRCDADTSTPCSNCRAVCAHIHSMFMQQQHKQLFLYPIHVTDIFVIIYSGAIPVNSKLCAKSGDHPVCKLSFPFLFFFHSLLTHTHYQLCGQSRKAMQKNGTIVDIIDKNIHQRA